MSWNQWVTAFVEEWLCPMVQKRRFTCNCVKLWKLYKSRNILGSRLSCCPLHKISWIQERCSLSKTVCWIIPAYKSTTNGIQSSPKLPDWLKEYFKALSDANLSVYPSPFCHQISAWKRHEAQDLLCQQVQALGKTECFMWPWCKTCFRSRKITLDSWAMRGVRTIIIILWTPWFLTRLVVCVVWLAIQTTILNIFRTACGNNSRRPQFGMYTGRNSLCW